MGTLVFINVFKNLKKVVEVRGVVCYTRSSQQRVVQNVQTIQEDSKQFLFFLFSTLEKKL